MGEREEAKHKAFEHFEKINREFKNKHDDLKIAQLEAVLCGVLGMRKTSQELPTIALLEGKPIIPLEGGDKEQIAIIQKMFGFVPNSPKESMSC